MEGNEGRERRVTEAKGSRGKRRGKEKGSNGGDENEGGAEREGKEGKREREGGRRKERKERERGGKERNLVRKQQGQQECRRKRRFCEDEYTDRGRSNQQDRPWRGSPWSIHDRGAYQHSSGLV